MIRRRYVYHVAGYDPIGAEWQHRRFRRELATFARTWSVAATVSDLERSPDGLNVHWTVVTHASNWRVETAYKPLLWDDLILANLARPMATRFARSVAALFDFVRSGAVSRYFQANWKYGVFFLFPYFMLSAFACVAVVVGHWVATAFALTGAAWIIATIAVGAAIFFGLLRTAGRRWRIEQALDDWIFSQDYLHGRTPDLDARLDRFADELVARARDNAWDEVLIVGHSMGATLVIDIVARALTRDPDFGKHGPEVCVLTVGSTIPKFTLHPAADRIRRFIAQVARAPSIDWAEYHARDDAISFYKFDPVAEVKFDGERLSGKPVIRRAQFHDMLEPSTFRRYRFKFMRMHYQFVMANERRSIYDFFMMVCGPIPFARSVRLPAGPAELISPDGTMIDPASRLHVRRLQTGDAAVRLNESPPGS
jgi:hypothetical protein